MEQVYFYATDNIPDGDRWIDGYDARWRKFAC